MNNQIFRHVARVMLVVLIHNLTAMPLLASRFMRNNYGVSQIEEETRVGLHVPTRYPPFIFDENGDLEDPSSHADGNLNTNLKNNDDEDLDDHNVLAQLKPEDYPDISHLFEQEAESKSFSIWGVLVQVVKFAADVIFIAGPTAIKRGWNASEQEGGHVFKRTARTLNEGIELVKNTVRKGAQKVREAQKDFVKKVVKKSVTVSYTGLQWGGELIKFTVTAPFKIGKWAYNNPRKFAGAIVLLYALSPPKVSALTIPLNLALNRTTINQDATKLAITYPIKFNGVTGYVTGTLSFVSNDYDFPTVVARISSVPAGVECRLFDLTVVPCTEPLVQRLYFNGTASEVESQLAAVRLTGIKWFPSIHESNWRFGTRQGYISGGFQDQGLDPMASTIISIFMIARPDPDSVTELKGALTTGKVTRFLDWVFTSTNPESEPELGYNAILLDMRMFRRTDPSRSITRFNKSEFLADRLDFEPTGRKPSMEIIPFRLIAGGNYTSFFADISYKPPRLKTLPELVFEATILPIIGGISGPCILTGIYQAIVYFFQKTYLYGKEETTKGRWWFQALAANWNVHGYDPTKEVAGDEDTRTGCIACLLKTKKKGLKLSNKIFYFLTRSSLQDEKNFGNYATSVKTVLTALSSQQEVYGNINKEGDERIGKVFRIAIREVTKKEKERLRAMCWIMFLANPWLNIRHYKIFKDVPLYVHFISNLKRFMRIMKKKHNASRAKTYGFDTVTGTIIEQYFTKTPLHKLATETLEIAISDLKEEVKLLQINTTKNKKKIKKTQKKIEKREKKLSRMREKFLKKDNNEKQKTLGEIKALGMEKVLKEAQDLQAQSKTTQIKSKVARVKYVDKSLTIFIDNYIAAKMEEDMKAEDYINSVIANIKEEISMRELMKTRLDKDIKELKELLDVKVVIEPVISRTSLIELKEKEKEKKEKKVTAPSGKSKI